MISLKKRQSGFTIVELLIVIIVIGILATLVIVTFTGIQQKARDNQRQTDVAAVASHVEAFNAQNGYYPSLADLQSSAFLSASLKGLDPDALIDPKGTALAGTTSATAYGYETTGCTNTTATSATNQCTGFTLTATLEAGGTVVKKSNT
ncbi:prepilin-type N-terminal cleavage/methylation domain-containing protein [Candidatus Saccharibacteria bacterium]|nr:prepilin-type N-terminal cleavage/methylation domain-containing protein [Candidatus Saccharibacteria bacterium]